MSSCNNQKNFKVLDFSSANLSLALSNEHCLPEEVAILDRTKYLEGYLCHEDIQAQTIVIEYEYVDGDYLDDFSSYYVRCFRQYNCRCKRIHFFALEFTEAEFIEIILGNTPDERVQDFKNSYRGFVVARPLPKAIIGRTALATYSSDGGRRHYPCIKKCQANLFGIDLAFYSLEYQEQDTVLAACATVALWCCFHKTSDLFHTPIWSPATITRVANEVVHISRPIPSHGLIVNQIHNAILKNNLVAEIFNSRVFSPQDLLLISLLYGYIRSGLPVLLGIDIEGQSLHAIALTGYSLRRESKLPDPNPENSFIPFTASRIDKFYAHDDQIGPFSRIWIKPSQSSPTKIVFDGTWMKEDGTHCILTPEVVIIPLYHKIRVTFFDIQKWLPRLNWVLFNLCGIGDRSSLEWDLYLTTTNDLKRDIKQANQSEEESLSKILFSQHPRFIWRAILKSGEYNLLDLFADATDMSRSFPFYHMNVHDQDIYTSIKLLINKPGLKRILEDTITPPFVRFLQSL